MTAQPKYPSQIFSKRSNGSLCLYSCHNKLKPETRNQIKVTRKQRIKNSKLLCCFTKLLIRNTSQKFSHNGFYSKSVVNVRSPELLDAQCRTLLLLSGKMEKTMRLLSHSKQVSDLLMCLHDTLRNEISVLFFHG